LRRLQELGLTGTARNVFSTKPRNQVVAQAPGASRRLAKGATVTLNVSKGLRAVPVPEVVGQMVADALSTLRTQGLKVRIVRVPSSEPAGQVVAQNPKAGATARASLVVVRLNVSDGKRAVTPAPSTTQTSPAATTQATAPPTSSASAPAGGLARVPDLEGKKLIDARKLLRKVGLIIEIRRVPNFQPLGTIVAQAKKPGTRLKRGSHLLVTVSMGRPQSASSSSGAGGSGSSGGTSTAPVSVPDVVGEDETTAIQDLQNAGLSVRVIDRDTADTSQDGIVLEQSPAASSSVRLESTVTIYVGRYTGG
jgi:eukaryotic-like serine/threonine-protein kinase